LILGIDFLTLCLLRPGEALPHYADPTHGRPGYGPNLLRRENIATTISGIPDDAEDHDLAKALRRWEKSHREAFSENSLARTITCGGGEFNYHPSGRRAYTDREMALLQTFPMDYKFCGRNTRKQIGNAVPPRFAQAVYSEVLKSLRETDEEEAKGNFT
jgi:DNA (cytosine-5)-methyltransferase 1